VKLQHDNDQHGSDVDSTLMFLEADRVFICGVRLDLPHQRISARRAMRSPVTSLYWAVTIYVWPCMVSHKVSFYFVLSLLSYGISIDYR
jgi:hypothetical protein